MKIRRVQQKDAEGLLAIYSPYVQKTAITFEYDVPSLADFTSRIETITNRFPYLVAENDETLVGYAYASTYYDRAAYDWTVEVSIYVKEDVRGQHIGQALYDQLERELKEAGFKNSLACIALPNEASLAFHFKRGYEQVAHFKNIGYKFGQWYDTVWLQKDLSSS